MRIHSQNRDIIYAKTYHANNEYINYFKKHSDDLSFNDISSLFDKQRVVNNNESSTVCRHPRVFRYDPKTDMWTTVSSLSIPRDAVGVCLLGDRLYAVGGYDGQSYLSTVESYDALNNEWTEVDESERILVISDLSGKSQCTFHFGENSCPSRAAVTRCPQERRLSGLFYGCFFLRLICMK